jgi:hypothetical protein
MDFKDVLILLSTIASHYDCGTDGSSSSGNYGYHLVYHYFKEGVPALFQPLIQFEIMVLNELSTGITLPLIVIY